MTQQYFIGVALHDLLAASLGSSLAAVTQSLAAPYVWDHHAWCETMTVDMILHG